PHGALVALGMVSLAGRHRVRERQLELLRAQVGGGDPPGNAAAVRGARIRDHVRRLDRRSGLQRHQLRVTGADADAEQVARAPSVTLASAVTAAAAIALPPRRPWTTR